MFTYHQKTGELYKDSALIGIGYSGHGDGVNNADMETVPDVGPICRGRWTAKVITGDDGKPCDYEGKKAPVIRLTPKPGTDTFGRSGFLCHGDMIAEPEKKEASLGCMVQPHYVRQQWAVAITNGDTDLEVLA